MKSSALVEVQLLLRVGMSGVAFRLLQRAWHCGVTLVQHGGRLLLSLLLQLPAGRSVLLHACTAYISCAAMAPALEQWRNLCMTEAGNK